VTRASALWALGRVALARQEIDKATTAAHPLTQARILELHSLLAGQRHATDEAHGHLDAARALYAGAGMPQGELRVLEKKAALLYETGQLEAAPRQDLEAAAHGFGAQGSVTGEAGAADGHQSEPATGCDGGVDTRTALVLHTLHLHTLRRVATLEQDLSAIGAAHRLAGFPRQPAGERCFLGDDELWK